MTTVSYTYKAGYIRNRPMADVMLANSVGPSHLALVDTGADYLQVPATVAGLAGISLSAGTAKRIRTAGGTVSMNLVPSVPVLVEGKQVSVHVLIDPSPNAAVILGREALLAAVEAGFNASEWLWEF